MGLSFPSIPGLSTVRDAVTSTVSSATSNVRDFGAAAVERTAALGRDGLDLGRRAVDAVASIDVREAAATVRSAIGDATESARGGIKTGVEWAGQQTHQAAEFARSHVTGDDIASQALRGVITMGETTTRFQLGIVGGVTREVVGLAGTVGELATTSVEMQLSPEARIEYGTAIANGIGDAAGATRDYVASAANDPSRVVSDLGDAVEGGKGIVDGQLDRYGQAIREGRGPETIGMDVGTVATYVVPVGGGPVRGAVTTATRGAGEAAVRTGAETAVRGTAEAVAPRVAGDVAASGVRAGEAATGARAAEAAAGAGRTLEAVSAQLREVTQVGLAEMRAAGVSNNKLGPAISAVMDTRTGEISKVVTNNLDGDLPTSFNAVLDARLPTAQKVDYIKTAGAGSHSEIYAVNEMLNSGSRLEDLVVYTQEVKGARAGEIKPPCPHCAVLLEGVTYAK
ncbi:YwqJ-related putative deaminase [Glacieibacterium frigidum]|uniref:YwqJ-like deaminase n=1 Tax=Glacieibacterium frigidum TaxID=2593303 RepID=A0A552U9A7_9SPHN|nr:YwqJ-related putative deaminase [Glacieibacterium frigidum]TRW14795.1 hypothetical protein FMM06_14030 [Glacieibacterium frigidum]